MTPSVSRFVVLVVSFAAMELVSYATHRWVMHGFAMVWHRSHHRPPAGAFERNDLFPLCFSAAGVLLFAAGQSVASFGWVAAGVTMYGAAYLFVHEIYIHRRLPSVVPPNAWLEWLREAHRAHHATGGEPYGMLLPLVRSEVPGGGGDVRLERSARRARIRSQRARL